jgi:hypothetical protein
MEKELQELLEEAEKEHQKLVLLQAGVLEKINLYKEENKKLIHLLILSKGKIDAYREVSQKIEKKEK